MPSTGITSGQYELPLNIPGQQLSLKFDFRERIGAGGFGEVWRVRTCGSAPSWHDGATKVSFEAPDAERCQLAIFGIMAATSQGPHARLADIQYIFPVKGHLWITTELAEGNLADIAGDASVGGSAKRLAAHIREAAEGLDLLHGRGLIHGRVKPSNILIVGGQAKIADFDLVQETSRSSGAVNLSRYGDTDYLAPEVRDGRLSPASDQYALALAYVAVRFRLPGIDRHVAQNCPDLASLPAGERTIVLRALAEDPAERFGDCRRFAEELAAVV